MKLGERKTILLALLAAGVAAGCHSFPYLVGIKQVPIELAAPPVSQLNPSDGLQSVHWEAGREVYIGQCAQLS